MKILLDSSGLDNGFETAVEAGKLAKEKMNLDIAVVGLPEIESAVKSAGLDFEPAFSEITPFDENPSLAIRRKKDSTINVGLNLLKAGKYDAFVSGGNTGAVLAGGMLIVGRINGVKRAALTGIVPSKNGPFILVDIGATADATPEMLLSFAIMASKYAKEVLGIDNPRVSLLSNGVEEHKGNEATKAANKLFKESNFNFIGNMEARDIFEGNTDILVTDGFAGNIMVKALEGEFLYVNYILKEAAKDNFIAKIGLGLAKKTMKKKFRVLDATKFGGVPLLGLKQPVIKAHGNSNVEAYYNSISVAKKVVETDMTKKIENAFKGEVYE
ncbi:MAG: phosphate acyltransferase PlsX [Ezakiella sp.]|nr:phosphate acyltransferase PlsX [Ezakiella sp.]MDD7471551.1 phosphate acyltransferase PlsX [Bacillota bacterium]MDY3922787.1 phosphate acyltransferase PlsX [Ezakiella sp.]